MCSICSIIILLGTTGGQRLNIRKWNNKLNTCIKPVFKIRMSGNMATHICRHTCIQMHAHTLVLF